MHILIGIDHTFNYSFLINNTINIEIEALRIRQITIIGILGIIAWTIINCLSYYSYEFWPLFVTTLSSAFTFIINDNINIGLTVL